MFKNTLKMEYNFYPENNPTMRNSVFAILVSVILLIVATIALPWYTEVVSTNAYLYSISKTGAEDASVLPVLVPLVIVLVLILIKPKLALKGLHLKVVFLAGLWVTLYSAYYYCAKAADDYTTPGFGSLIVLIGGVILMFICIVKFTQTDRS